VDTAADAQAAGAPALPGGLTLNPGEQVIQVMNPWWFATIGYYFFTLGLWEIWRRRNYLVLTSQRIHMGHGIIAFKKQQSLPLDKVQDATYSRTLWVGNVLISSAGGSLGALKRTGFRPARAKEFVIEMNSVRHAVVSGA
jgi:hypothetical protein